MKKYLLLLIVMLSFIKTNGQEEYEFVNKTITLFPENKQVPMDSIYLMDKFITLDENYIKPEFLNEETIKFWWSNSNSKAPVELFIKNFNFSHLKSDLLKKRNDTIVNFKKLENYFFKANDEFVKNNPKKNYLSISLPYFNCNKNWCFIIKSEFIPYTNTGGSKLMYIYVKVDDKWVLYNILNL